MAVQWKLEAQPTRDSEYAFDPADIVIKPGLNGRHDSPDITGLVEDIVRHGQISPVEVRQEAGKPVLVSGMSRFRAIVQINKKGLTPHPLKVRAIYARVDERQGFLRNISENHFRNQTTPLDDAHNCAQLEKWGLSIETRLPAPHGAVSD